MEVDAAPALGAASAGCGRPGPATIDEALDWSASAWRMLAANSGPYGDLVAALKTKLTRGVLLSTEYSGMGGPEEAMRRVVEAGQQEHGLAAGTLASLRAGDWDPHCRTVLAGHVSNMAAPQCIFGDIMDVDRCSAADQQALRREGAAAKQRLWAAMAVLPPTRRKRKELMCKHGRRFFQRAAGFMLEPGRLQALASGRCHCYKHDRKCRFVPSKPQEFAGLMGLVAGFNCYDWSVMTSSELSGWLGRSAHIYLQFLSEALACGDYDFMVLECTWGFDESIGLAPMEAAGFQVAVLKIAPTLLGLPVYRERKYMLLTKTSVLQWAPEISAQGHQESFEHLFRRDVVMRGGDLARATRQGI